MLTQKEFNNIFNWMPYRDDWSIDRNPTNEEIKSYYGNLISDLSENLLFSTYYSQDGGMGNYLEFICYPLGNDLYDGNAIMVCISLCAPIAVYGQTRLIKFNQTDYGWNFLSVDFVGIVLDENLKEIESKIKQILSIHNINEIDKEFASRSLPTEMIDDTNYENLNTGNQYLNGLFQHID